MLLGVIMPALSSFAQSVYMPAEGKWEIDSIYSQILKDYRQYSVYLPSGYENSDKTYPILFLLHGMSGTHMGWVVGERAKDVLDPMIAAGKAKEMIVVSPNAGGVVNRDWNGYFNMPGWNYEDFFFEEFIPYIEKSYRVKSGKDCRAIAGLSMGGGGAVSYAQRHPEMFCSCYAMSALVDIPQGNEHPSKDENDKVSLLTKAVRDLSCIRYVQNANDTEKAALRTVKWFVDCGDDDFLLPRNIEFFQAMKAAGIPLEFRVRDGGHTTEYWHTALYECLPFVSNNFKN